MLTSVIECRRVRKGVETQVPIEVEFYPPSRRGRLPLLVIRCDFRPTRKRFATQDVYRVEEIPSGTGRAFLLHRSVGSYAAEGPDVDERYGVELESPVSHRCECRGHAAAGYCKHVDALAFVLGSGHLDHGQEYPVVGPDVEDYRDHDEPVRFDHDEPIPYQLVGVA